MRANTITANPIVPPVTVRPGRRTEVRDPYDGLRPWSAITHGLGAVLAVTGTAALLIQSAVLGKWLLFGLFAVYGLSMVCLYTASTLYHCLNVSVPGRLALRKYDHCSIYLLIAGSYTPLCLTVLRSAGGLPLVIAVWVLAAAGTVLTIAKLSIPRWLTSAIYLFMGWLAIFAIVPIFAVFTTIQHKRMRRVSVQVKTKTAVINGEVESAISGIRTAQAFANENEENRKFNRSNDLFREAKRDYYKSFATYHAGMEICVGMMSVVVIAVGGALIMENKMDYTDLITFSLYVTTFITPIRKLSAFVEQFMQGMAGFGRFVELMRTEPEIQDAPGAQALEQVKGDLELEAMFQAALSLGMELSRL